MGSAPYAYVRALEFEGRHPHDVGQWGVTNTRLQYLEGTPEYLDDCMVPVNVDGTFDNTPTAFRRAFWPKRIRFYRRIRSAIEAADVIQLRSPNSLTKVAIPLSLSWVVPNAGFISMPAHDEPFAPETHAIHLKKPIRLRGRIIDGDQNALHFLFENSWGKEWGQNGMGLLPFAYYDKFAFEHWSIYNLRELIQIQTKKLSIGWGAWQGRDEFDRRVYAFEAGDPDRERLGWAFASEINGAIELEELFVAPDVRGKGIGGKLADQVAKLAKAKGLPLRAWVSFADSLPESPKNAPALPKIAKRLGVQFHQSHVRWAAYYATSDFAGSEFPIEPLLYPVRAKSTRQALNSFFATVSLAGGNILESIDDPVMGNVVQVVSHPPMTLESPEWIKKNTRRVELIRKKNREGLNDIELRDFIQLQETARSIVEAASPRPKLFKTEIDAILAEKTG